MVQIHFHLVGCHFHHHAVETVAILVLQGDDGALSNMFSVETTIDHKHLLVQIDDMTVLVSTVSILRSKRKVEVVACGKVLHLLFEGVERNAHAADEGEWAPLSSLLHECVFAVCGVVKLVSKANQPIGFVVHCH